MLKNSNLDSKSKFLLILESLGFVISSYLFISTYLRIPLVCGVSSCGVVNSSQYAYIIGIPISFYGIGFYALCILLTLLKKYKLMFALSIWGVIFSAYLTYLEAFVLKAWCQWCIVSAWLAVCIFTLAFLNFSKNSRKNSRIEESVTD